MKVFVGFAKLYILILKLSKQVPTSFRGDAHRIGFLQKAILSYQLAREPLPRVATHNFSFQQLYGDLEASLQLKKEAKLKLPQILLPQSGSDSVIANIGYVGEEKHRN